MLEGKSNDFKTIILLKLTKQLVKSTDSYGLYQLKKILSSPEEKRKVELEEKRSLTKEELKERLKKQVKEKLGYSPSHKILESDTFILEDLRSKNKESSGPPIVPQVRKVPPVRPAFRAPLPPPVKRQPQQRFVPHLYREMHNNELPQNLQYLKPTKTQTPVYFDLDKLNPFINDPNVKSIETEGADEDVYVTGTMGRKPTGIKFSSEEIDEIIDRFSKQAKIPKTEGLFKVVTNNLMLTAMISESLGSRFVIKKM